MLVQPSNPQNSSFLPLEICFSLVYGAKKYKGPRGSSNLQKFTLAPQITAGDGLKASVGHTIHTHGDKSLGGLFTWAVRNSSRDDFCIQYRSPTGTTKMITWRLFLPWGFHWERVSVDRRKSQFEVPTEVDVKSVAQAFRAGFFIS